MRAAEHERILAELNEILDLLPQTSKVGELRARALDLYRLADRWRDELLHAESVLDGWVGDHWQAEQVGRHYKRGKCELWVIDNDTAA